MQTKNFYEINFLPQNNSDSETIQIDINPPNYIIGQEIHLKVQNGKKRFFRCYKIDDIKYGIENTVLDNVIINKHIINLDVTEF